MKRTTLRQLAELPTLTTPQLKERWKALFGGDAPQYNRPFLIKRLAYRIQELTYGGLSEDMKQRLTEVLETTGHDELASPRGKTAKRGGPVTGTKLVREYNGQRIEVVVVENGFQFQGRFFRSLSGVAREITGTNWNGPAFFGLRSDRKQPQGQGS